MSWVSNVLRGSFYGGVSVFGFYEVFGVQVSKVLLQKVLWRILLGGADIPFPVNPSSPLLPKTAYTLLLPYAKYTNKQIAAGKGHRETNLRKALDRIIRICIIKNIGTPKYRIERFLHAKRLL